MTHQNNPSQSWEKEFEEKFPQLTCHNPPESLVGADVTNKVFEFLQSVHDEAYKAGEDNAIAQINKLREAPELTKDS